MADSSVVLVHGAFVDGSGWEAVFNLLRKDGYSVGVVQHATASLAGDVAETRRIIAEQDGPVILVGHSYGGMVITEAGNDLKVAGLVYVDGFAGAEGESVEGMLKNAPPGAPAPPFGPRDGRYFLDKRRFHEFFAADLDERKAAFMAESQLPWGAEALRGKITKAAWRSKPTWYLVGTEDRLIPPEAQRAMAQRAGATVVEIKASHAGFMSQPRAVAELISEAARSVAQGADQHAPH